MLLVVETLARGRDARDVTQNQRRGSDEELVLLYTNLEGAIMLRKVVIALAATAAIIAGSALDATAKSGGGGGGGHGGGGHGGGSGHGGGGSGHSGGMGGGGMSSGGKSSGGMSNAGMSRSGMGQVGMSPSGFARMSPGLSPAAVGHPGSFARVGVAHPKFASKHHRIHNRFFVFAGGYPYSYYYNSCYERIWTRWGWRLTYVCGPYDPY
jgi:hypothetical protein